MPEPHARTIDDCIADLDSNAHSGLTHAEAAKRLNLHGPNELREVPREPLLKRFLAQFTDLIVIILLAAAAVSAALGEWHGTIGIGVIVILNAVLGFVQEERAERSLAALRRMAAPKAKVVREGGTALLESREVVPGDIIDIATGDLVPADMRIIEGINLQIDEAPLTGESVPVHKDAVAVLAEKVQPADRRNMVFSGTTVTYGRGRGLVAFTGMNTEVGKIAGLLQRTKKDGTPLQRRLEGVGRLLIWVTLGICAIIFVLGVIRGDDMMETFMTAVALAVAAIPEGLPAVVTIGLAIGVQRMVKRHVLIRKLPSVETLGCVSVICTDKTGTLTQNAMTVRALFADGGNYAVSGTGYGTDGEITLDGARVEPGGTLERALRIGLLCNDAKLARNEKTGRTEVLGDPTEAALLVVAAKGGLRGEEVARLYERIGEIPFDSERKAMSVVVRDGDGRRWLFTKGAPDVVLRKCAGIEIEGRVKPLDDTLRAEIERANRRFGDAALRVLGVAYRELDTDSAGPEQESGLIFTALCAMIDPPREEVRGAVEECVGAGIKPVMITGDHKATAMAIAKELGIWREGDEALSGAEIDGLSDAELFERLEKTRVYARVTAEHKIRVVAAWRRRGRVVAVTGDGVNDAPAVKQADIGISMGITGTDVTKEASDMIITDDNFASIIHGVEEGRTIYANIKKFIHFLLSCNIGEVFTMFIASLVGWPAPLMAVQILWINLVTDGLPALALGVEKPESGMMRQKPRPADEPVLPRREVALMFFQGLVIALATLAAFHIGLARSTEIGRTMAFATLVVAQLFHSFNCRSRTRSVFSLRVFSNRMLLLAVAGSLALQVLVISLPFTRGFFNLGAIGAMQWLVVFGLATAPVFASEAVKLVRRRRDLNR